MPASGRYLLDTNIVIALFSGERPVEQALLTAEHVFIPVIVAAELYFAAANSGRPHANRELIDRFLEGRTVLSCDLAVAREYGRLKRMLKVQGTPLPENDLWIAAIARHFDVTLVSRDSHFAAVHELVTVVW